MGKIRFIIISVLAVFLQINSLYSQGGSNYSIFGVGDIYSSASAYYEGLGGTSIAFPSEHSINTKNPALWSLVKNTRLHAGYRFHQNLVTKGENQLLQNNGQVDGVFSIFAIDSAMGLAASFGIYPYSSVNYLISTPLAMVNQALELNGFII